MTIALEMAPIQGITDSIFRQTHAELFGGFDRALAPFLKAMSPKQLRKAMLRELEPSSSPALRFVPQLITADADNFTALVGVVAQHGHREVNWNLACPQPTATKKGRGAGLLPHPERIAAFLDRVLPRIEIDLSVKLRLGLEDPHEIDRVMDVLAARPIKRVVLHPRTATQMYGGAPDLDRFAAAASRCPHPLVYSGDIVDRSSFDEVTGRFPKLEAVMIGRGAIADPFLPRELKTGLSPTPRERLDGLYELHKTLLERYRERLAGPAHLIHRMNGYWEYFQEVVQPDPKPLKQIRKAKRCEAYEEAAQRLFDDARSRLD